MRIDFGKYDGQELHTIPTGYLRWVLREVRDLSSWLRRSIEAELAARGHGPAQPEPPRQQPPPSQDTGVLARASVRVTVQRWFSEMSREFHPDRGGHHERMLALNAAHERLKTLLGV
jgi:hypothetical protein